MFRIELFVLKIFGASNVIDFAGDSLRSFFTAIKINYLVGCEVVGLINFNLIYCSMK